jgi:hypothetical protein
VNLKKPIISKISTFRWSDNESLFYKKYSSLFEKNKEKFFNNPFFNTTRVDFARSLFKIKIYELIKNSKGSIVELGTFKGNGLMLFYHLMLAFEPTNYEDKLIAFDTFAGFRNIDKKNDKNISKKDFSDTNYEFLNKLIEINKLNDIIMHIPKVHLVKGDAVKTIPNFVKKNKSLLIKLLYLDCPIYKPTFVALKYLYPLVVKGGIIAFDELGMEKWAGETIAFKKYFGDKVKLKKFDFEPSASYFFKE